jgi:hypothetical protein
LEVKASEGFFARKRQIVLHEISVHPRIPITGLLVCFHEKSTRVFKNPWFQYEHTFEICLNDSHGALSGNR